jgi:hypothetical protein
MIHDTLGNVPVRTSWAKSRGQVGRKALRKGELDTVGLTISVRRVRLGECAE